MAAAALKVTPDFVSSVGVAIVLGCETDFVGKNENFLALASQFGDIALKQDSKEAFLAADFGGMTVADKLIEQTGVIGEKLDIKAFEKVEAAYVGSYVHINKIAAVVGLSSKVENAAVLVKDLAMQVASMGATTLSYKDFDPAFIASETEARIAVIEKDNIVFGLHIERLIPFVEVAYHAVDAELGRGMRVGGEALDQRVFAVLSLPNLRPAQEEALVASESVDNWCLFAA